MQSPTLRSRSELLQLSLEDLESLALDMRQTILSTCMANGGHLGASLGAVELAIALHVTFESPREPIIWDVGHQAYAHKLLTGRWDQFHTLRTTGGISGFLSRAESEHDVFGAGHSSTALSAALACAWARDQQARPGEWSVAVVGDGGFTAGLTLEALSNIRSQPLGPLLIVLNDNQMSISPNVGAIPAILAGGAAESFFGLFGLDYVGPIDGHDLAALFGALGSIRSGSREKPVVLHVLTQKGRGYAPAEEHPSAYHGVSPIMAKVPGKTEAPKQKSYSEAFGDALCEAAAKDARVVAITAAMPEGTGLSRFAREFPDRFFDVGIAEQHAVTFAAGLATQGFRPVVAIYSTFLQRACDSVIHDVALQGLPVVFAIDRAGLVGADGPTHHGAFDMAILGAVPGIMLVAPACLDDVPMLLSQALQSSGPTAIRYPRGGAPQSLSAIEGRGYRELTAVANPSLIAIAIGSSSIRLQKAAELADPTHASIRVYSVVQAKPFPKELLDELKDQPACPILITEDGSSRGGVGQDLAASLGPRSAVVEILGYPDRFVPHGSVADLESQVGISRDALSGKMRSLLST